MYEGSNASKTFGHQSAHAVSLALNPGAVALVGNATGVVSLGVIKTPMPTGRARLIVRSNAAYASGESLAVVLRWQDENGNTLTPALATLDDTNVDGAGEHTVAEGVLVGKIPEGTVVSLSNTYVPGGGANDPNISLVLQLY